MKMVGKGGGGSDYGFISVLNIQLPSIKSLAKKVLNSFWRSLNFVDQNENPVKYLKHYLNCNAYHYRCTPFSMHQVPYSRGYKK